MIKVWIHERLDWPTLTWDSSVLSSRLADIRYRQGWLLGRVESLGFDLRFEAPQPIDPILKAGVAHLWFVTIHPFEDGNGRIARAIADMALARADGTGDRVYSMSSQIERERKTYYKALERQQRSTLDITQWLEWFLACLGRAMVDAEETLAAVLCKARLWD